jgi:hypothetical protein
MHNPVNGMRLLMHSRSAAQFGASRLHLNRQVKVGTNAGSNIAQRMQLSHMRSIVWSHWSSVKQAAPSPAVLPVSHSWVVGLQIQPVGQSVSSTHSRVSCSQTPVVGLQVVPAGQAGGVQPQVPSGRHSKSGRQSVSSTHMGMH